MCGKLFNGHQIFQPNVLTTLQCSVAYPLILQAELFQIFFFFFFFYSVPCKWNPCLLQWKHRVLITGLAQRFPFVIIS